MSDQTGALVISLDFELHWGVRDHVGRDDPLYRRLPAARRAVTDMVALFAERGIEATWATVGLLFASTRQELASHRPDVRPSYRRPELDPYGEEVGIDEERDPEHLAGSLVELISRTPGQEVGSHTFSHYYCLEAGQDETAFRADLAAARSIATARGLRPTSLVLPRNQWNPDYATAVLDSGFTCYRGPQPTWGHASGTAAQRTRLRRGASLVESYAGTSPPPTVAWDRVCEPSGLCNVPASAFLRPFDPGRRWLEPRRLARLRSGMRSAARRGRIFHLWWHPHNFSDHRAENMGVLERLLDEFAVLATTEGMRSLSMGSVAAMTIPPGTGSPAPGGAGTSPGVN